MEFDIAMKLVRLSKMFLNLTIIKSTLKKFSLMHFLLRMVLTKEIFYIYCLIMSTLEVLNKSRGTETEWDTSDYGLCF
jgi:hypothetical protein